MHTIGLHGHVGPVDKSASRGWFHQGRQDPQGGRLSGTVRSDKAEDLSSGYLEGDGVQSGAPAVDLGELLDGDHLIVPESVMAPAAKPLVVLKRKRTRPVCGLTALSGSVVVPLSW